MQEWIDKEHAVRLTPALGPDEGTDQINMSPQISTKFSLAGKVTTASQLVVVMWHCRLHWGLFGRN